MAVLQLKYDFLIAEKRYDPEPHCHEVSTTTRRNSVRYAVRLAQCIAWDAAVTAA